MTHPIVNIADVELHERPTALAPKGASAERFEMRLGFIAPRVGAQRLGYNLTVVPPGKRAFPMHSHRVNDEMFFVLESNFCLSDADVRNETSRGSTRLSRPLRHLTPRHSAWDLHRTLSEC
jgi:uncharacterized cupin superfamily protein